MPSAIFLAGATAGTILFILIVIGGPAPRIAIWPTPAPWSLQSVSFWTLFRIMNVAVIAVTVIDLLSVETLMALQVVALGVSGVSFLLYGLGLASLGRENVYCGMAGLVTSGIYRWTRNPQYATIIPAYAGLAAAAQSLRGLLLAVLATAVFLAMAFAEERWLSGAYGVEYERYRAMVPRFYSFHRFGKLCTLHFARIRHHVARPRESSGLVPARAINLRPSRLPAGNTR